MAQQTIDIGAAPNDGLGDPLRDAFDKANDNFTELYTAAALGISINFQTGTTYTLDLADANNVVVLTNGAAITLTIPTNAAEAFPVGTVIELHQGGAGVVTVDPDTGVTLLSRGSLVDLAGQEAVAAVRKMATNTWRLTGDIA